jgi:ABC-type glycerol-3-phosphate transport system permease component
MRSRQNEKFKIIFLLLLVVVIFVAPIYIIRQSILSAEKKISVTVAPHLTPQEFTAQSEKLNSLMRQQGMTGTFNYVSDEIKSNPSFARDCHPLLHDLGHAAYSYYGGYAQAIKYQNEICDSGYTHGVLESYLSSAPKQHVVERLVRTFRSGNAITDSGTE